MTPKRRLLALLAVLAQLAVLLGAAIAAGVVVATPAAASHFRAGQLNWQPTANPREVQFDFTQTYRRSFFFPQPIVGSTVTVAGGTFSFGDGTSQGTITGVVTNVNTALDLVTIDSRVKHTYPATGTAFSAYYQSCCRLSSPLHRNNPDGWYRVTTTVSFAPGVTGNPASAMSPVVDCPKNGLCQFFVPASDRDGMTLGWRMATVGEAAGGNPFRQPQGGSGATLANKRISQINAATGVYEWDTTTANLNTSGDSYFSTQVIVTKSRNNAVVSSTAVDFFIRVTSSAGANQAPVFASPTPADGSIINVPAGQQVSFDVKATDPNAADTVTIGVSGAPSGSVTNTPGNPATSRVAFTPTTVGDRLLTLTAQDQFGSQATQRSVIVRVGDSIAPVVSVPTGLTLEATGASGAAATFTATAVDNVDGAITPACTPASGTTFALGATTVTCSATDAAGNAGSASFVVSVNDTTGPQISALSDLTAEAADATGATVSFGATATDLVDGARPVSCSPASGSRFPLGDTVVTCTSSDTRGNRTVSSFTVTVSDTTAPLLSVPGDITVEATSAVGATVNYPSATAHDDVDPNPVVGCTPSSGSTFALGSTPVSCSARDASNNTSSDGFRVSVVDTTPPVLTLPDNLTVEATGSSGAAVEYTAGASDVVDGPLAPSCSTSSGSIFGFGETIVSCSVTDAAGNTGTGQFSVTVVDTRKPLVGVPADIVAEASGPAGATVTYVTSAFDVVDGAITPTCSPASGTTFALGSTKVSCEATDAHGNTGTASFDVEVVDTTAPSLDAPEKIIEEAAGPAGAIVGFQVTATDIVDGPVVVTCTPASGATFGLGTTVVACDAADSRHNRAGITFPVTVRDTTPPALVLPPNKTVEATGPGGAVASYAVTANDAVDGDLTPTCSSASGSTFPLGDTIVTCSVADAHGNDSDGTFTISVVDTTAPELTVAQDQVLEATGPDGAVATFAPATATDAVDGSVAAGCDRTSGAPFAIGDTTVVCSATDAHGNTGNASFTITVRDTTAPVVKTPEDQVAEATGPAGAAVIYPAATAHDLVDGDVSTDCAPASGGTFALGMATVTCTASDTRSNIGSGTFTVTVQDTTPPAVSSRSDITAEATGPGGANVSFATPDATDLVDGTVGVSCTHAADNVFPLGTTNVTCSATDSRGNTGRTSLKVIVVDTTPPTVNVPSNLVAEATGPSGASVNFVATATDLVDGAVSVTCSAASGAVFPIGNTTVSCSATDRRANTGSAAFTVSVRDTTAPTITWSGNAGTYTVDQMVSITCRATDTATGIATSTCSDVLRSAAEFPLGTTTLSARATDGAGNTTTSSTSFTVVVTSASLCSLTGRYSDKAGITTSLCAKIRAAQAASDRSSRSDATTALTNYRNEVAAQSGKALTASEATTLTQLATALAAIL